MLFSRYSLTRIAPCTPKKTMKYTDKDKYKTDLYPKDLFAKLEFDKIQELLTVKCISPMGKELVAAMSLTANPDEILQQLRQTNDFKQLQLFEEQGFPASAYLDLKEEIMLLGVENSVLNEQQFFRMYQVLKTVEEIVRFFAGQQNERRQKYPHLFAMLERLTLSKELLHEVKLVLDDNGKVRTDASKELLQIRRNITARFAELERKFNAIIAEYKKYGWLTDSAESIRNGRRVLSVIAEHKRKVKGIVHDESGTGSTTYIEPEATVYLSNEITELQQAEKREIFRILRQLTQQARPHLPVLKQYRQILGLLDFVRAKALFAIDTNASMPRLSADKSMEIFNARHPLLYLKNKSLKKNTVPLTFSLSIAERILVVSGPNAGGKSVLLKTVGLMQVMLQTGMLIPADDHSILPVFRNIFVDIGDEQSIENDLSTYSSRLRNMRYFTEFANAKTLLLIDEFGSGTDPALGGAIAEAILEYLNKKFCYGVITTHYSNIKVYATNTPGIINGCMLFDHANLQPLYKLDVGKPGSSFAFELAVKSGLNDALIQNAKSKVNAEYKEFDELLSNLQREKQAVLERERIAAQKEEQYRKLLAEYTAKNETLEQNRKKMLLEAQQKAQAFLEEANRKFENMVREWNENKEEKNVIKKIKAEIEADKARLNEEVEELKEVIYFKKSGKPVAIDSLVQVRGSKEVGKVLELRKNMAIVQFDQIKTHISTKELEVVERAEPKKESSGYNANLYNTMQVKSEFKNNIDIRGMRREEALKAVEDLLDKALMLSVGEVKIIHGIGDGILRRAIRDLLRNYRAVKSVSDEEPQYGGAGVSIVELN
ncbi:endonuclease MutS2 [Sphingobacteriales bacterium UPWRP_1]|nr:endonuclease MutS2 [Sphingobacteriales bacterium UPWRP_1]